MSKIAVTREANRQLLAELDCLRLETNLARENYALWNEAFDSILTALNLPSDTSPEGIVEAIEKLKMRAK